MVAAIITVDDLPWIIDDYWMSSFPEYTIHKISINEISVIIKTLEYGKITTPL